MARAEYRTVPFHKLEQFEELQHDNALPRTWTTDETELEACSTYLEENSSYNVAKLWKIDGLGPVFRDTGDEGCYVLKDRYGFWYVLETEPYITLWAFTKPLDEWELIANLPNGGCPAWDLETSKKDGTVVNCDDADVTYPYKIQVERRSQNTFEESTDSTNTTSTTGRSGTVSAARDGSQVT